MKNEDAVSRKEFEAANDFLGIAQNRTLDKLFTFLDVNGNGKLEDDELLSKGPEVSL